MEEKGRKAQIKYEKPELVDMMKAGVEGQENYCDPGSGAAITCYNGIAPGAYCDPGTDHNF